jgi:pyrimidine deaminase RibD-like protein
LVEVAAVERVGCVVLHEQEVAVTDEHAEDGDGAHGENDLLGLAHR